MKRFILIAQIALCSLAIVNSLAATDAPAVTHINDLSVHDPCILTDAASKTYFIYRGFSSARHAASSTGGTNVAGVQAFWSKDLTNWFGPTNVFVITEGFWADRDANPWAPEVHPFQHPVRHRR